MSDINDAVTEAAAIATVQTLLETQKGYPPDSVSTEIGFPDGRFVDLAVFNPETETLLAVFEFKRTQRVDADSTQRLRESLDRIETLGLAVPRIGVLFAAEGQLHYYRSEGDGTLSPIEFEEIPSFASLVGSVAVRKQAASAKAKSEAQSSIDRKGYLTSGLATALFLFGVLDWWDPTWELLALLAAAVGLVFLPDVSRLKVHGFEVEFPKRGKQPPTGVADGEGAV